MNVEREKDVDLLTWYGSTTGSTKAEICEILAK